LEQALQVDGLVLPEAVHALVNTNPMPHDCAKRNAVANVVSQREAAQQKNTKIPPHGRKHTQQTQDSQ
jgi:hypothetical protein